MRIAVITDEVSQDLDVALDLAAREGFDGVEIRSVWNRSPSELTERQAARVAAAAAAVGLEVAAFASFAFKGPLPRERRALRLACEELRHALAIASALGTGRVRVFSFCRERTPEPVAAAAALAAILVAVPADGAELVVETGTPTHTPTGQHLGRLLGELGERPTVRSLWDPANSVYSGFDAAPFPAGLDALGASLAHVHVKDPAPGGGYAALGQGTLPWPEILADLRRRGYDGWLSLETHWRLGHQLSDEELFKPGGDRFSNGGREASEDSMRVLARWCGRTT